MYKECRLSTDALLVTDTCTSLILDQWFADTLPTHYRCYHDQKDTTWPIYWLIPRLTKDRYSNRYINVQSTKMSAWFIGQISADTAYKTSDPWFISYIFYGISLLWKGKKCSYLILGTLKPGMAKTNDKPVVQRRLQQILPVQPTSSKVMT